MNEHAGAEHPHEELTGHLRDSIGRLRRDLEARSDPLLVEVSHALELLLDLTSHAHEHAVDNRRRIEALETER